MAGRIWKYGAAAAFGAVAVYVIGEVNKPAPAPTISTPEATGAVDSAQGTAPVHPALAPGFYRPSKDIAEFYQGPSGALRVKAAFHSGTCVEVINGDAGYPYAAVRLRSDDTPPQSMQGFMKKEDLRAAPECAATNTQAPVPRIEAPTGPEGTKDGYILNTEVILYKSPEGREPVAVLRPGQCIKVEGVRASESWTHLSAYTERGRVDGWGMDVQYNHFEPCTP